MKKKPFENNLSRRIQRENDLTAYLTTDIYKRLIAGNEIDLWQEQRLQFTSSGEFVLITVISSHDFIHEERMAIPPMQAISRISNFVSDVKKQDMLETVVSRLKWFSTFLAKSETGKN